MRSAARILLPVVTLALLVGGVAGGMWAFLPRETSVFTDASGIETPADAAQVRDVLWMPPVPVAGINSAADEYEARVTADGGTMYFVRGGAGGGADIWVSHMENGGWSTPQVFEPARSGFDDMGPSPSADGRTVYFYSDRPGGQGGYDLWRVRREGQRWRAAENLGPAINSPVNDYGAAPTPDGQFLYFASNRPVADDTNPDANTWAALPDQSPMDRHYDLYVARVADDSFTDPQLLPHLSGDGDEGAPAVSPVGDFLYFASDRPGGQGGFDLYRARIIDGVCEAPEALEGINSPANELDPSLSQGGFRLYFSSDRRDGDGAAVGGYDVHFADSREVFRDVRVTQARFDWLATLVEALPWLIAGVVALVCLAVLRRLAANPAWRRRWMTLSLMARCLIVSLLAHLLLGGLLTAWRVQTSLEGLLDQDGGSRVTLVSSAIGSDIVAQVRSTALDLPVPTDAPTESPVVPRPTLSVSDASAAMDVQRQAAAPESRQATETVSESLPRSVQELAAHVPPEPMAPPAAVAMPGAPARVTAREGVLETSAQQTSAAAPRPSIAPASQNMQAAPSSRRIRSQSVALTDTTEAPAHRDAPAASTTLAEVPAMEGGAAVRLPDRADPQQVRDEVAARTPLTAPEAMDVPVRVGGEAAPSPHWEAATRAEAAPRPIEVTSAGDAATPMTVAPPARQAADVPWAEASEGVVRTPLATAPSRLEDVGEPDVQPSALVAEGAPSPVGVAGLSPPRRDPETFAPEAVIPMERGVTVVEATEAMTTTAPAEAAGRVWPEEADVTTSAVVRLPGAPLGSRSDDGGEVATARPLSAVDSPRVAADVGPSEAGRVEADVDPTARVEVAVDVVDGRRVGESAPAGPAASPEVAMATAPAPSSPTVRLPGGGAEAGGPKRREAPRASEAGRDVPAAATPVIAGRVSPDAVARFDPETERQARDPVPGEGVRGREAAPVEVAKPGVATGGLAPSAVAMVRLPSATPPQPRLRLYGLVINGDTGEPLEGATVRLDLEAPHSLEVLSDASGGFEMTPEEVPDHVAVVAFKRGFEAAATNVSRAALREGARLVFALIPESAMVIALEENPVVHHLGNDEFTGRINSQFQRRSEGMSYRNRFELTGRQAPDRVGRATLRMLVKGAQIRNEVRINGRVLATYLNDSPADGSFGEFEAAIPLLFLREGENRLEIRSIREEDTDYDDFEFTNVRIVLEPAGAQPL